MGQEQPTFEFVGSYEEQTEYGQKLHPSIDKYIYAGKAMKVRDMHAFMRIQKIELQTRSKLWVDDYLKEVKNEEALARLKKQGEPKIIVDVDDCGKCYASVECIECHRDIRVGMKKNKINAKCFFNRQNYDKHMHKVHLAKDRKGYVFVLEKL